jgi:hypothetical protein
VLVGTSRTDHREFIIEAGTNRISPENGWRSFFTIEKHGESRVKSELFFLATTFEDPEEAINAALVQARGKIDKKVCASAHDENPRRLRILIDSPSRDA